MSWRHPLRARRYRKAVEALRNMPPGYGEKYHYHSHFDDEWDSEYEEREELLAAFPADEPDEYSSILTAFKAFTACRVCGFKARICSAEACPQRKGES